MTDAQTDAQDRRDAAAYRDLMAGTDSSRFETAHARLTTLSNIANGKLTEGIDFPANELDSDTRETISKARELISNGMNYARSDLTETAGILRDDSKWPGDRAKRAEERVNASREKLDTNHTLAGAAVEVATESIYAATRPVVKDGEQTTARADARMLLDHAEPGQIMARVNTYLANNPDDSVSALLADPRWLTTYLTGRGIDPGMVSAQAGMIRATVAKAAAKSPDKRRQAAAKAITHVDALRAGVDVLANARGFLDPRGR